MRLINLKTNDINQNGYHKNFLTKSKIGFLYIAPTIITPENCLACDGYILKIVDYELLYAAIGNNFSDGTESEDEFRIPDYNITKRFLQPSFEPSIIYEAGLPSITGTFDYGWACHNREGAFYGAGNKTAESYNSGGNKSANVTGFNASRCSGVYGNSTTVQPPSQGVHVCIRYK